MKTCPKCGCYTEQKWLCPECGESLASVEDDSPEETVDDELSKSNESNYSKKANESANSNTKEKAEAKAEKKKKIKKILIRVAICIGAIVLIGVAISLISYMLRDTMEDDINKTAKQSIHTLEYEVPSTWKLDEKESDISDVDFASLESANETENDDSLNNEENSDTDEGLNDAEGEESSQEDSEESDEPEKNENSDADENKDDYIDYTENASYYRTNDDGENLAYMKVYYLGDDLTDETIDAAFKDAVQIERNEMSERTMTVGNCDVEIREGSFNYDDGTEVNDFVGIAELDYSVFMFYIESKSDFYKEDVPEKLIKSIKFKSYKNPRTAIDLKADYTGDRKPSTRIKSGSEDVDVVITYKDGGKENADKWTMNKSITLVEGEKRSAVISCHGLTCKLEVAGRKPVKLTAKYSGETKAGTVIDEDSDITVKIKYDTGEEEEVTNWEMDPEITLKAGEESVAKITAHGISCDLKVQCTTLSKEQYKAKCVTRNYKNLLRKSSYGEKIKIYGQVLQDCGSGGYRISSSGGYDDVFYVVCFDTDIVEDDWVTVYGETAGVQSYETVLGATKSIPKISAKYIDR